MTDRTKKPQDTPIKHAGYTRIWEKAVKGELDGRSIVARAVRELKSALVVELGGEDNLTTQESIILDRAVAKTFRCQAIETLMFEGEPMAKKTEDLYLALSNSLRKDLLALGLRRRSINVNEQEQDLDRLTVEELLQLRELVMKAEGGTDDSMGRQ